MRLISSQVSGNVICHDVQMVSIGVPEQQSLSSPRGCFHPAWAATKARRCRVSASKGHVGCSRQCKSA